MAKKEEGKGKRRKRQAGDEGGPSPEGESSKQLEEGKEEYKMQTGTANEAGNKRRRGRPRGPPPSEEEKEKRRMKKIKGDRERRKKDKCEVISLRKLQKVIEKYCEEKGITEDFKAYREKHEKGLKVWEEEERQWSEEFEKLGEAVEEDEANQYNDKEIEKLLKNRSEDPSVTLENLEIQMNQTGEQEGVTAVNSSSFGATGTPFERAKELIKRKREEVPPPQVLWKSTDDDLGLGIKKEVSVYDLVKELDDKIKDVDRREQEAEAASIDANRKFKEMEKKVDNLNKQVKRLNKEVSNKLKAELAEKGKTSEDALELQIIYAVTLGWNLKKELLQSMHAGSEFLNLPLLDTIQLHPSLQNQFNEGLRLIGKGHPIDDKVAIQSDDPPVVVPRSFFSFHDWLDSELNGLAPQGDSANIAANSPQFQTANARANNVEQEDDANDQEDG